MPRASSRQRGLSAIDVTVICVIVLFVGVGLLLPALTTTRGGGAGSRMMQNSTQLRGIHQGMFTYAQFNKTGGRDGFHPGLDSRGNTIPVGEEIPASDLLAASDVPGYAAAKLDHVLPGEMNPTAKRGFVTRVSPNSPPGTSSPPAAPATP